MVQREHGRHHVTYTPSIAGCHRLHVTVRGLPVKGSPFAVQVAHGSRSYSDITEPQLTFGGSGSDEGKLSGARGLTVDEKGRTLVCDRDNFRVQVFDATGKYLFTIGRKGQKDGEFPGGPFDVAVTKDGRCRIVVTDWSGGPCQIFESTGEFVTKFGSQGKQDEQFGQFCHIEAGPQGEIYVSDYHNRQIQVFDRLGNFLFKFTGSLAEDDGLLSSPNGIVLNNKGMYLVSFLFTPGLLFLFLFVYCEKSVAKFLSRKKLHTSYFYCRNWISSCHLGTNVCLLLRRTHVYM